MTWPTPTTDYRNNFPTKIQFKKGKQMAIPAALQDKPGLLGATTRFWQRSYAADYVGYVLLQLAYFAVRSSTSPSPHH